MAYDHQVIEEKYINILRDGKKARLPLEKNMREKKKAVLRSNIGGLNELRVAGIMDEFTRVSYGPECQLIQLMPDRFMEQINEFKPDLVFIESAWNGYKNAWFRKVDRLSPEICALTAYCKSLSIPTVFWNKEDPVSLSGFMNTAGLCDYVFTTDVDAIGQYKMILGHDRVYHLHFAAQPLYHNPIEEYDRKDKISFAGAYYPRYPERMKVMDAFTHVFMEGMGMDIYDRNYHNPDSPYSFPEQYKPLIVGTLKPEEIGVAYKGYRYGLNMNSISQSQTMFARRVFELMASNTVVVGNYSRGVKNYFGDLTICTDSPETLRETLDCYCGSISNYEKYRLLALRKVLSEHLYEDRLDQIIKIVFGISLKTKLPKIYVLTDYKTQEEKDKVEKMLRRQSFPNWEMVPIQEGEQIEKKEDNSYYTFCSLQHYYGEHYLLDLVLSTRYAQKDGYVKGNKKKKPYTSVSKTFLDQGIVKYECLAGKLFSKDMFIQGDFLATDPFHFKQNHLLEGCPEVDDVKILDQGLDMEQLHEHKTITKLLGDAYEVKDAAMLYNEAVFSKEINGKVISGQLAINSILSGEKIEYVYLKKQYTVVDYEVAGKIQVCYDMKGALGVTGLLWFFDQSNYRMGVEEIPAKQNVFVDIPRKACFFQLGFRVLGEGQALIQNFTLGKKKNISFNNYYAKRPVLVVSGMTSEAEIWYEGQSVHRRVMNYKDSGLNIGLMYFGKNTPSPFGDFKGVSLIRGGRDALEAVILSRGRWTFCIHYLTLEMWEAIVPHLERLSLIIWLYGLEREPCIPGMFMSGIDEKLANKKKKNDEWEALWGDIALKAERFDIRFIASSQHLYKKVNERVAKKLPKEKVSIICYGIDTKAFAYQKKPSYQRKKILSINSFSSEKYANDLTVQCILELSKRPFFDELEFRIIGDGAMYDEMLAPLKGFGNVILERKLLNLKEVAQVHQAYGVFLCPNRYILQEPLQGEAMASGLVPVTNGVAATSEFVDESCGILAPAEDYMELANAIEKLYYDEELFSQMSYCAAMRVRNQSDAAHAIKKEVELIKRVAQEE